MRTGQTVKPAEFHAPQIFLLALSLAAVTAARTPASQICLQNAGLPAASFDPA
jgi:hypothetical protein